MTAPRPQLNNPPQALPSWLAQAIEEESQGKGAKALDLVYDHLDALLLSSEFSECNRILESLSVSQLSSRLLLGILTITLSAKGKKLPARENFGKRVWEVLEQRSESVEELLQGLL